VTEKLIEIATELLHPESGTSSSFLFKKNLHPHITNSQCQVTTVITRQYFYSPLKVGILLECSRMKEPLLN
jgi:hypothetical protein